ncbi:hypothetical protein BDV26DRAFT_186542 [Aspergillus bertholletiae]|uniref:Peptidase family M54-domain-containing protein n=1 Tax=Aspergillus bertholletiae TaxID=1226010 RepID=A0A5N7BA50_9EURO|nr:hypothetical protein BDV26DRAFT_186542 [Aspergillus bertholletiae]
MVCPHGTLNGNTSQHAGAAGYRQPSLPQRKNATRQASPSKHSSPSVAMNHLDFPAPLVLPGDDLALDPDYPPQSFQEWLDEGDRNKITPSRKTVYVVALPRIGEDLPFLLKWAHPKKGHVYPDLSPPQPRDVCDYVAAFYHGLPVKLLTSDIYFLPWDEDKPSSKTVPKHVGLVVAGECIRIRTRACPDKVYARQLNLDDLLDAAISMLPKDAYALCMLVDHDLYEDDDDIFVCGRAYGGSRVAVVSNARYHPGLDKIHSVEREHAWPASHCQEYINGCCRAVSAAKRQKVVSSRSLMQSQPLKASVAAASALPDVDSSLDLISALWLSRMCRTVSHELGHCFGIDHCVYYACSMQGSASLAEDARQPPYLCPVDLTKVLCATGATAAERDRALVEYCNRAGNRGSQLFEAFAAWCQS